ncbi:hypothetical protein CDD83_1275 [Cordyceps sp. RAO-2017]|nr:hypothetical protein CDD83_1275 [Cordyceps sp. RAO-2017]
MEQQAREPELNALGMLVARLAEYGHNASHNIQDGFAKMTVRSWLRIVMIIGGYMLLRPYLLKFATKKAVQQLEKEDAKSRGNDKMTPNEFRGIKEKLYEAPDDEGDGTSADWGSKARMRQRQMLKNLLEEEERRRAAENEDADIQEFLED